MYNQASLLKQKRKRFSLLRQQSSQESKDKSFPTHLCPSNEKQQETYNVTQAKWIAIFSLLDVDSAGKVKAFVVRLILAVMSTNFDCFIVRLILRCF